jgi:hypothetical protein
VSDAAPIAVSAAFSKSSSMVAPPHVKYDFIAQPSLMISLSEAKVNGGAP